MRTAALIGILAFLIAACAHQSPQIQTETDSNILLLNRDLERTLRVDRDIRIEKEPNGLPKIRAKIKNITAQEILHLQAQTIWSDNKGRILTKDTTWQTLALTPGQTTTYEATASNQNASQFVIRIRYLILSTIPSKNKK